MLSLKNNLQALPRYVVPLGALEIGAFSVSTALSVEFVNSQGTYYLTGTSYTTALHMYIADWGWQAWWHDAFTTTSMVSGRGPRSRERHPVALGSQPIRRTYLPT